MWKAVKYLPKDLLETSEMTREYYGESWVSDPGFLKWQYEDNPAGPAVIQLARDLDTNQLAGQNVVIPMRFKTDNRPMNGTLCLNILTREAFCGQGIFTGLAEPVYQDCIEQGLEFCYAFPNPNSYPGFIRKLGFTDLGSVPLLLRPLNPKALVQKKLGSLLAPLALPFHLLFRVKEPSNDRYEVYPLSALNLSELNAFWTKIQHKYPIMGIRDADYLRWRYFDIPLRDYQIYGVRHKNSSTLLGYIVGRCTEVDAMASGMIVDFLIDPSHPATGSLLVNRLLRFFVDNKMDLAGSLMMPHTEEARILKANRFFTCPKALEPQPFRVVYRRFKPALGDENAKMSVKVNEKEENNGDSFLQLNHWFLTMGDYDVI
ncbi:GNAT family N-acetyltransferase [Desulfosporosinus fructosivorans]